VTQASKFKVKRPYPVWVVGLASFATLVLLGQVHALFVAAVLEMTFIIVSELGYFLFHFVTVRSDRLDVRVGAGFLFPRCVHHVYFKRISSLRFASADRRTLISYYAETAPGSALTERSVKFSANSEADLHDIQLELYRGLSRVGWIPYR
jgi:hypothetical protein